MRSPEGVEIYPLHGGRIGQVDGRESHAWRPETPRDGWDVHVRAPIYKSFFTNALRYRWSGNGAVCATPDPSGVRLGLDGLRNAIGFITRLLVDTTYQRYLSVDRVRGMIMAKAEIRTENSSLILAAFFWHFAIGSACDTASRKGQATPIQEAIGLKPFVVSYVLFYSSFLRIPHSGSR